MTTKEFVNGLLKVSERHENDKYTVFDDNWCEICKASANYILELQRKIDELEEANAAWVSWRENEMAKAEENRKKDINTILFEDISSLTDKELKTLLETRPHYDEEEEEI